VRCGQGGLVYIMVCVICDGSMDYVAIGPCDHPICSLCSLRMRVKSHDKNCPLCKQSNDVIVVFGAKNSANYSFASFSVWGIDTLAPGFDADHNAGIIYADCNRHFLVMSELRSTICPVKYCCSRFPSDDALLQHLRDVHTDHHLCKLCVKVRCSG
jgi:hypothetical protein